jgi:hypothetical protein
MSRGQQASIGAQRIAPNGYHYTRCEKKWRLTHHLTAEKVLGRALLDGERVVFRDGFDRRDYANPDAIQVTTKGKVSPNKQLARLYERKRELEAQIADLEAQ